MDALTNEEVRLNSKFRVNTILQLNIIAKANEHASMFVKGIVDELEDTDALVGEKISLTYQNEDDESVIFIGYIKDYKIHKDSGYKFIEIYSISLSGKLDENKKKRSFQDKRVRYSKLLWEVLKPYGNVHVNLEYNQLTQRIYLQYDETDWGFIKRIAGYMNVLVIPDMTRDNLGLSFGIKKGKDKPFLRVMTIIN